MYTTEITMYDGTVYKCCKYKIEGVFTSLFADRKPGSVDYQFLIMIRTDEIKTIKNIE